MPSPTAEPAVTDAATSTMPLVQWWDLVGEQSWADQFPDVSLAAFDLDVLGIARSDTDAFAAVWQPPQDNAHPYWSAAMALTQSLLGLCRARDEWVRIRDGLCLADAVGWCIVAAHTHPERTVVDGAADWARRWRRAVDATGDVRRVAHPWVYAAAGVGPAEALAGQADGSLPVGQARFLAALRGFALPRR